MGVRADWVAQDGWVALLLEDIDGRLPVLPWSPQELTRVLATLAEVADELTASPLRGAVRAADALASFLSGWSGLAATPPDDLDPWAVRHLDALAALERSFVAALDEGETLCHVDVRSDNILVASDRIVLVDWNWVAVGPRWLDSLLLGWEVITAGGNLDTLVHSHRVVASLDRDLVVACMAAGAGTMQLVSRLPRRPGCRPFVRGRAGTPTPSPPGPGSRRVAVSPRPRRRGPHGCKPPAVR